MSATHTPGPWHWRDGYRLEPVNQDYTKQAVSSILDREGGHGYVGRPVEETLAELDADFALIAAAPELLEVLQVTAGNIRSLGPAGAIPHPYKEWLGAVESAIARATQPTAALAAKEEKQS